MIINVIIIIIIITTIIIIIKLINIVFFIIIPTIIAYASSPSLFRVTFYPHYHLLPAPLYVSLACRE